MDDVRLEARESAELDDLLDESGFAASGSDPEDEEYDDESGDVTEADLVGDGADDDQFDDDESDSASYANAPSDDTEQLREYAARLEHELSAKQQSELEMRRWQTAQMLQQMRDNMTNDEWVNFQTQMTAKYAMHLQNQMSAVRQTIQQAQYQQAESDARSYAVDFVSRELKLNRTEKAAISAAATPSQMKMVINEIKEARREQTSAARNQVRENRLSRQADSGGGRGAGSGRSAPPQFKNIDDLVDSIWG